MTAVLEPRRKQTSSTSSHTRVDLEPPRMLVTKLPCAFSLAILVPSAWNGARSLHLTCASDTTDLRSAPSCRVPQRLCLLVKCKAKFAFPLAIVIYCLAIFWATVRQIRNCGPVRTGLLTIVTCYRCTVHVWVVMLQAVPLHSLLCKRAHDTHHTRQW